MNWQNYFDKIFVINLPKRTDRLQRITEVMNEYGINAFVFEAIEHEDGRIGLATTMKKLFIECLEAEYKNILVFEDDTEFLECPEVFHQTMNKCVNDLMTIHWDMFYLGVQHCQMFSMFRTPNLLPVSMGYSTHSVAYSRHTMKYFVDSNVAEPIDNFLVRQVQPRNTSFCSYPLLATQADTYSDIEKGRPQWHKYIENNFQKFVIDVLPFRFTNLQSIK